MKMRILVCGSRDWKNTKAIEREIRKLSVSTIIEGEARGADRKARIVAEKLGLRVMMFPADWNRYGKGAGVIRNEQMLREGKPDLVLAFHSNLGKSKGTKDMVVRARKRGIPVKVFIK